jgi:SAM-dependent methyltransferase
VHDTARHHGRLFFELYGPNAFRTVVELGSQDVNGSLRDHCPPDVHYIGIDVMPARGVDLVVKPDLPLPVESGIADAVVTSSAFEHDVCFWDTFLELTRILRPGGVLYLNAPANGDFHRYPLDCWRFYPDAGVALVQWASRHGTQIELLESFIGLPQAERWADFVAVFRKAGSQPPGPHRIADHVQAINIHRLGRPTESHLHAQTHSMPDQTIAITLSAELATAQQSLAVSTADLAAAREGNRSLSVSLTATEMELVAARRRNDALSADLEATRSHAAVTRHQLEQRIGNRETALRAAQQSLAAIESSTCWRATGPLRRLARLLRG